MLRSTVRAVGAYLPSRVVTNEELSARLETSDDWIRERTGIRQRHIAAEGEVTSDLAAAAAKVALERADIDPATVDLVVVATSTPDLTFPATAVAVQRKLGLAPGAAFGPGREGHFRLCFAQQEATLAAALDRITGYLRRR
jgi:3-oxoacyl-[acyl-carrier-protein] synthase-3